MGISRDEESQQEDLSDDDDEGVRSTLTGHVVQFGRVRSRRWLASALVTACLFGCVGRITKKSLGISGRYRVDNAPTADASPADAQVAPFYEKL